MLYLAQVSGLTVNGVTAQGPIDYVVPIKLIKEINNEIQPDSLWPGSRSCRSHSLNQSCWPNGPSPIGFSAYFPDNWINAISAALSIDPASIAADYLSIERDIDRSWYRSLSNGSEFSTFKFDAVSDTGYRRSRFIGTWGIESFPTSTDFQFVQVLTNTRWIVVELSDEQRFDPAVPIGDLPTIRACFITSPRVADIAYPDPAIVLLAQDSCFESNGWYRDQESGSEMESNLWINYQPAPAFTFTVTGGAPLNPNLNPSGFRQTHRPIISGTIGASGTVRRLRCPVDSVNWIEVGYRTAFTFSIENCWFVRFEFPDITNWYKRVVQIETWISGSFNPTFGNTIVSRRFRPIGADGSANLIEYSDQGQPYVSIDSGVFGGNPMLWTHTVEIEATSWSNQGIGGRLRMLSAGDPSATSGWYSFAAGFPGTITPKWGFRILCSDTSGGDGGFLPPAGPQAAVVVYDGPSTGPFELVSDFNPMDIALIDVQKTMI